jgi:sialate O-acetylesterase
MKTCGAFLLVFVCTTSVSADVKLPAIFSDHMVLQADASVPVWGWAEPGEEVTVSFAAQSQTAKAGSNQKGRS